MKQGRALSEVLTELQRQNAAKQDFIGPAQAFTLRPDGSTFEIIHMKLLTVLLADIPFEEMFYDFLQNISQKEYAAAIELMRQIAEDEDIRKAGEVIQYRKNRESESKNVIDNEGLLQVKRIFAVLANRQLREKYFRF